MPLSGLTLWSARVDWNQRVYSTDGSRSLQQS